MNSITENLNHIHSSINSAVTNSKREENSVKLLCVSKTKPKEMVIEAYNVGERHFGESYAVEASENNHTVVPGKPKRIAIHISARLGSG